MMIRLAIALALAAAVPRSPQDEKPSHPPYRVDVTAKTGFAKWKDAYQEFQDRLKKILPGAQLLGQSPVPGDKAGWEVWRFKIAWDAKFDQAKFNRLFGEMKIGRMDLTVQGTAAVDTKSKAVTLTAFGEKIKLKLLNRPKKDFNDVPENNLAKFVEAVEGGQQYFNVTGEVLSSGEIWAIYLDDFSPTSAPKK